MKTTKTDEEKSEEDLEEEYKVTRKHVKGVLSFIILPRNTRKEYPLTI